jgi:hypothetical protein
MDFDQEPEELKALKNVPPRDPRAAARGRAHFLAQAKNLQGVPVTPIWRRIKWTLERPRFALFARAMLLALMFVAVGSSAAVVAAQDALPNEPLYAVKLWTEDVRVDLTADPETRADLLIDFANRRAGELAALPAPDPAITNRAQAQLQAALQIAAQLDDAGLVRVLTKAEKELEHQARKIEQTQVREMIQAQRALVQLGLQNKNEFRQRVNAGKDHTLLQPVVEKPTDVGSPVTAPAASNDSSSSASPGNSNASPARGTPPAEPPGKANGNPPLAEPPGKSAERTPPGNAPDKTPGPPPDVTHGPPAKSTPEQKIPPGQTRRPQ